MGMGAGRGHGVGRWDSEQGQANGSPRSPAQNPEESKVASPGSARCSRRELERNPRTDPGLNEKTIQTNITKVSNSSYASFLLKRFFA